MRVVLMLVLLAFLVASPSASAQAALHAAHPAPNGHVDAGGSQFVELRFTQAIERAGTTIDVVGVVDQASRLSGPLQLDADESNVARVPLVPLSDGYYSVSWTTLSPDAHTARGSYLFAAGNASVKFASPAQARDASETPPPLVAREAFARAVTLLGVAFALGIPLFVLVAAPRVDDPRRALAVAAAFALLGALASALSWLFLAQRAHLALSDASATLAGRLILARAVALALAALALAFASWRRLALPVALLAGGAALAATALGSRAAWLADQRAPSVAAEVALLAGLALACGAAFGALLTRSAASPRAMMFSGLALVAVAATFAALRDLPSVADIMAAAAGVGVMALAVVLALAFALRGRPSGAVMVVVLVACVGLVAAAPPPDRPIVADAASSGPPLVELGNQSRSTHVVLDVAPAPLRANASGQRIDVALHPLTTSGIPAQTRVTASLVGPDGSTRAVPLVAASPSAWSSSPGTLFTKAGPWHVDVTVERPDDEPATLGFDIVVEAAPSLSEVSS